MCFIIIFTKEYKFIIKNLSCNWITILYSGYQNDIPMLHPLLIPPDLGIGDSLDIQCSLKRGSFPITFEWKVNGKAPTTRIGIQINTSQKRSNYIIDHISSEDVGNYTCSAMNSYGSDNAHATLDVEGNYFYYTTSWLCF